MLSDLRKNSNIHLLIGENGAGKSRVLSDFAHEIVYSEPLAKIITIANTIHNKFPALKIKNYHRLPSNKINQTSNLLIEAITSSPLDDKNEMSLEFIRKILSYIGFDTIIEISFKLDADEDLSKKLSSMEYTNSIDKYDIIKVKNFFYNFVSIANSGQLAFSDDNSSRLTRIINLESLPADLESENLISLLRLKYHLNKLKIVGDIKIALFKSGYRFSLNEASSGELTLLTMLTWISMHISKDSYILIDEPENSLHPKWQRDYFRHLNDVFHYYEPKFICATHSPMVVSGAHSSDKNVSIYKISESKINRITNISGKNVEEILKEVFQVITPESRYFSFLINELISKALNFSLSESAVEKELKKLKGLTDDKNHHEIIDKVPALILEVKKNG